MRACCLLLALLLSACSTATGGLPYAASGPIVEATAAPIIGRIITVDQRGVPPNHLGAVRGGYGNPLKTIETTVPVQEEVARAFKEALLKRKLFADPGNGKANLTVTILKMDCSQLTRREAHADFQIMLSDPEGHAVYQDNVQATIVSGSVLALDVGIFGDPDELRAVAIEAMSNAIDKALDKPGFRSASQSSAISAASM
jgi:hypothetical protein